LHVAAQHGRCRCIELLIELGADKSIRNVRETLSGLSSSSSSSHLCCRKTRNQTAEMAAKYPEIAQFVRDRGTVLARV